MAIDLGSDDKQRKDRIARNEVLFRDVNERVRDISGNEAETIEFLCECGDPECTESIPLAKAEYEGVRADPVLFVVAPGHEIASVETVVEQNDRFFVVRKHVDESEIARENDPRG